MNYLDMLRSEKLEKRPPTEPTKPTEGAFVSNVSAKGEHISEKTRNSHSTAEPTELCPACGSGQWWQLPGHTWHCRVCEPDMPLTATTLTLPCHTPPSRPVPPDAALSNKLAAACEGLSITPDELRAELHAGGDLADVVSGELSANGLRLVAESLVAVNMLPALAEEAKKRQRATQLTGRNAHSEPARRSVPPIPVEPNKTGEATVQAAAITGAESLPDPKTAEALALLAQNLEIQTAVVSDDETDADNVILTLAIRGQATCQLRVPRAKYDGLAILELLEQA